MSPINKVSKSSTFWVGLGSMIGFSLNTKFGWGIPPELFGILAGGYAVKEAGAKIGEARQQPLQ